MSLSENVSDKYWVSFTSNGQISEIEPVWRLCRYSNDIASAAYGLDFLNIVENSPNRLADLDLRAVEASGRYLPMLHNGYNNYSALSSRRLKLTDAIGSGIALDAMLIIPEPQRLLERPSAAVGLGSALSEARGSSTRGIIDPLEGLEVQKDRLDEMRVYDSHPGSGTYCLIIKQLLDHLQIIPPNYRIEFEFAPFACDLAARFSDHKITTLMVTNRHMAEDLSKNDGRNTGIQRLFQNANAPIKSNLLLIGDSHSNSAIAPHLSFIFEQVRFIWASRRNAYDPFGEEMRIYVREADYIIEEIAERFFLNNFCVPCL